MLTRFPSHMSYLYLMSEISRDQQRDQVSRLQQSIPAETSDTEAYHSLVPINTKLGATELNGAHCPSTEMGKLDCCVY